MRVILTRPGGSASLLAGLYLNLLLCQLASLNYLRNPFGAAALALVVGFGAWLLFIWPAERLATRSGAKDPIEALFETRTLAWAARISLTIWLAFCLRFSLDLVEGLLEQWLRIGRSAEAIELLPALLGYTLAAKILSALWLGLALAGSCRDPRCVASSVRFFNRVAIFVLVGVLLFYRKALSTMAYDGYYSWTPSELAPAWLYLSASTLLAPTLLLVLGDGENRSASRATVLPVAIAVGMGSIVPAASVRAIQMGGSGFTGSMDFLSAIWLPLDDHPLSVSSGFILALACFGFAQIILLATRLIWRGRLHHPRLTATLFASVCWAAGPEASWGGLMSTLEALLYVGTGLSALAGIVAARGLMIGVIPPINGQAARRSGTTAALGGVLTAICAAAWSEPWEWTGFAPSLVSTAIMFVSWAMTASTGMPLGKTDQP